MTRIAKQLITPLLVVMGLAVSFGCQGETAATSAGSIQNEQRTVLITGANRGIGLELARQYVTDGWQVIGTARNPDSADELKGLGAEVVQLDVTEAASVERLVDTLADRPIDILINNAGILPMMQTLDAVNFDDFERVMAVNTTGPVRVTHALIDNLRAGNLKIIVNITSNLGSIEENTGGGFYGYRESKAALNMFTRTLAAEFGPDGFICIAMHPGWVQTDMGGPNAPTTVVESATGIRSTIDSLSSDDNGTYRTFEGGRMPW